MAAIRRLARSMSTTRKPSDEFESLIRLGYGEYDQTTVSGYVGGGITESTAGRLSFWYRDREGYEKNTFTGADVNDNEEWGLRGKLLFAPTDTVEINTAHLLQRDRTAVLYGRAAAAE